MAGSISIKLNLDGALQLKQQLEETGNTGSAAFDKLRAGLERLGAQDTGSVVQALQRITQAQQQAVAATAQAQTAAFAGIGSQTDYKARAADIAAYAASMDAVRAKFNPLFAASKQYESTLDEITNAEKIGAISATEAAAARDRLTASYAQANAPMVAASAALKKVNTDGDAAAKSLKGGQMALNALALQSQDFFVQVTSGGGLLRPLIQQGSQVVQQLQASGQGIGAFGSAAKIAIGAVLSPMGLLVTGAAAAAGAITILGATAEHESTRLGDLRQQLRATRDDYVGLTDSIDLAAKKAAATATISLPDARVAAQTIGAAKYFSGTTDDILQLTRMSVDLARVWNTDIPTAAARLRDAINDPAAAAAKFASEGLPAFNNALVTNVTLLERAGRAGEAQKIVRDALSQSSRGAATDESALSKALRELQQAFTGAETGGKSFGNTLGTFINDQIAATIKDVTSVVKELNDVADFIRRNGSKVVSAFTAPLIDQNTGKAPTGITLPNGASNDIYRVAEANGISPETADFFTRIIGRGEKSPGQYAANGSVLTSPAGAIGLSQLMPATAADKSINPTGSLDPTKLDDNILLGLRYLAQLSKSYNGNEQLTAAAYNAGPGRTNDVLAGKASLPDETAKYVQNVTGSAFGAANAVDDRKDHQGATSAANASLAADNRRLSDSIGADTAGTRAVSSLGNAADLEKTAKELQLVNSQIEALKANGDTSSDAFKQATAQADGLKQKTQELLAAERNRLDPQQQFLRGLQDQVAANAGLTEGEQRIVQLRQQMADIERSSGGSFTPEQRAAALGLLNTQQQQELARQVDTMRIATAGQDNLSAAYGLGYDAVAKVTAQTAGYTASLKYGLPGSDQQRAAADSLTAAYERQAASANKVAVAQATRQNSDQLTYIDAETKSLGMNDNARTAYLAHLQAEQFLLSKNIDLTSAQGQAYLASVDKISAASAALKGQEASLNELTGFFDNTFSTISDSIVSAFATGEQSAVKFKDVAASVVKAVEAEFIKLALINPLKDLLLGSTSPNLLSVGGIIGGLLGNTSSTSIGSSAPSTGAVSAVGALGATAAVSQTSQASAVGSVAAAGAESILGRLTGGSITNLTSLGSYIVGGVTSALGNTAAATNIALAGEAGVAGAATAPVGFAVANLGQGASGVATASEVGAAAAANAAGASNATAGVISQAAGKVADALPYIGTAITIISDLATGNYRGAGLVAGGAATGAAIGSIIPGIGTAVGAAVGATIGGLIDAFLPNHPKHPFEDVELNVAGGRLATGKSDGQLADVQGLVAGTQKYVDNINNYLDSVGVKIATADGNIGRIGQGITGLAQTLDPSTTFNRLDFTNATPDDRSNFSIAKGALDGMKFDTPQALADELGKIAGFADAASTLGIQLASVGRDVTNIAVASVSGANAKTTTTVQDASGLSVTFLSDLRTALNADLPKQSYADTAALDAEMQKVSDFLTGSLPSLLTPIKVTQSTIQDQYNAIRRQYDGAEQQSKAYGLNNDGVLNDAMNRALAIFMEPTTRALNTAAAAVAGRFANLALGTSGSGAAANNNLMYTQANERAAFDDSWRQAWGDSVTASDAYKSALQQLISTQNLEAEATRQQMQLQQEQAVASLAASEADFAKRAGMDSLAQQLSAYDTKAQVETDTFIASWRAYYGEYSATGEDFQNQMIALYKAHYTERLQIESDYATTSNAALKTAQGSVTSLFGSIKDYALKLQTGSQSALSPTAQYDLAKSQFQAVAGAAQAGDATSASQLTTYADALLTTSRAMFDTGIGYANDYNSVIDAIQGISTATDSLTQSFITQNTQSQTDQLVQTLQGNATSLQNEITALRREVQGLTRQMAS